MSAKAAPTPASGLTDATGTLSVQLRSTQAGAKVIVARAGATQLTGTASFVPGPPSSVASSIACSPSTLVANGSSVGTVVVIARDAFGNSIPNDPIAWSSSAAGSASQLASSSTDSSGTDSNQLTGTATGAGTLTGKLAAGLALLLPVSFVSGSIDFARSSLVLKPNVAVADGSPISVAVVLRDALPDLIVSNTRSNTLGVFLGASGNSFAPQVTYFTDVAPGTLQAYDVDGDGLADVVALSQS